MTLVCHLGPSGVTPVFLRQSLCYVSFRPRIPYCVLGRPAYLNRLAAPRRRPFGQGSRKPVRRFATHLVRLPAGFAFRGGICERSPLGLGRSGCVCFGIAICIILAICLSAAPAISQILYGSIVGIVKDAQGATVPGATVTIVNKETNLTRDTVTNAEGAYSLMNVLPGPYDVKISLHRVPRSVRSNVPVTIGQISRVDVALEVGTLTETVTVASAAQLLQTDKADVSTELKSAEITAMPLNRFRNYQALVNLVPGTTPMAFGNAETDTPARSLATNVNGQANTNNSTRTDGATNMNIWLPNHNMYHLAGRDD